MPEQCIAMRYEMTRAAAHLQAVEIPLNLLQVNNLHEAKADASALDCNKLQDEYLTAVLQMIDTLLDVALLHSFPQNLLT